MCRTTYNFQRHITLQGTYEYIQLTLSYKKTTSFFGPLVVPGRSLSIFVTHFSWNLLNKFLDMMHEVRGPQWVKNDRAGFLRKFWCWGKSPQKG